MVDTAAGNEARNVTTIEGIGGGLSLLPAATASALLAPVLIENCHFAQNYARVSQAQRYRHACNGRAREKAH